MALKLVVWLVVWLAAWLGLECASGNDTRINIFMLGEVPLPPVAIASNFGRMIVHFLSEACLQHRIDDGSIGIRLTLVFSRYSAVFSQYPSAFCG